MNLLLLFIFMNSCHLAQCEMMGHSCATRRAGAEFTISHTIPPSSPCPPSNPLPLLIAHAWMICWIWMEVEGCRGKVVMWKERFFFFVWLRMPLSPVSHLRRCGTRINGIQQCGGIASGYVWVCVCVYVIKLHMCSCLASESNPTWTYSACIRSGHPTSL